VVVVVVLVFLMCFASEENRTNESVVFRAQNDVASFFSMVLVSAVVDFRAQFSAVDNSISAENSAWAGKLAFFRSAVCFIIGAPQKRKASFPPGASRRDLKLMSSYNGVRRNFEYNVLSFVHHPREHESLHSPRDRHFAAAIFSRGSARLGRGSEI
jgi:hypothetical protein